MPPQWENLCVIGTLFLFGHSSLTIAGTACDTWRTSVCDGVRTGNRGGGGGSNLGRRRPRLPLGMADGKSSWVDVSICTNDGSEEIGSCNGGISKEVGGCTDGGSKEIAGCDDGGYEEVGAWTEGKSKEIGGCIDDGSKEVKGCTDGRFEEMSDYTNREDKKVEGCNDANTNKVVGWQLIYLPLSRYVDRPWTSGSWATVDWAVDPPPPCSTYGIQ